MELGIVFSQADSGTDADVIRDWARGAEAAGFSSLMAYDHILGASRERLGPGPFGAFPHAPYTNEDTFHEVFVLFSHLAAVTTTLQFVTSVVVLPQRQAPLVAKQVATLDLLSGGRLQLAVGVGWNPAEYEGLGVDFRQRTAILEEQVEVMRKLWTEPLVTFEGRFHTLDRVGITPLPSRPIPVWVGSGGAEPVLRRVARIADGWVPLFVPGLDSFTFADSARRLRQCCEDIGRDPATMPIHARTYLHPGWERAVEEAMEVGVTHFSLGFNRMAEPGVHFRKHLDDVIAAKPTLDAIVGR